MAAVKCRPVLQHCVVIFSGPQGSWTLHFNVKSLAYALGGVSGMVYCITTDEQLQ